MADLDSPDSPDATPAQLVNKALKRALFEADKTRTDFEEALGMSHAAAWRGFTGQRAWRFEELTRTATWLSIDRDTLLPEGGLTWDLVLALT